MNPSVNTETFRSTALNRAKQNKAVLEKLRKRKPKDMDETVHRLHDELSIPHKQ